MTVEINLGCVRKLFFDPVADCAEKYHCKEVIVVFFVSGSNSSLFFDTLEEVLYLMTFSIVGLVVRD